VDNPHDPIDVLISHCADDRPWADYLDGRLREAGLSTYLSALDLRPGSDITLDSDDALRRARNGVVLVSDAFAAAVDAGRSGAAAEYSALVRLADGGRLRLIPVLLSAAPLPPMLSRFEPISLIGVQSQADLDGCLPRLLATVRGEQPPHDAAALLFDRIPEGPLWATLCIDDAHLTLASPAGTCMSTLHDALSGWFAGAARSARRWRDLAAAGARGIDSLEVGGPVGHALGELVRVCERRGSPLRLGVQISAGSPLNDLPWEGMRLPGLGEPVALTPNVVLYRSVTGLGEVVDPRIPGPLRILAVIASPDRGGGALLDYEHELATILEQVDAARRDRAYVRILNWGSVGAIREALAEERFHVLHVSCHAEPGRLVLEKPDGDADLVAAVTFARRVLVPGRTVPLVVLAGCSTALGGGGGAGRGRAGEEALPSYARTLLEHGVPAVLAMTARVTDLYATDLLARMYRYLAREPDAPDPLSALSDARRDVESARHAMPAADPRADLAEWATPAMFTRVRSLTLFDASRSEPVRRARGPRIDHDIVNLEIGDFVGRRRELRLLLAAMRGRDTTGVLIHGIGGVGKSSLAAAVLHELAAERRCVVTLHGRRTVDEILRRIAKAFGRAGVADTELGELADPEEDLADRLDALEGLVRDGHPLVLLLDDPLGDPLVGLPRGARLAEQQPIPRADADLLAFLDRFLDIGAGARIMLTVRTPTSLDGLRRPARLARLHLGQLSPAETAKLLWRLPHLYNLDRADRERAYLGVGGHPRALEYLNALLQAGQGKAGGDRPASGGRSGNRPFASIADRLERALAARGIEQSRDWLHQAGRTVGHALAEVVATSAAEVLLDGLYHRLDGSPVTQRLLVAGSVFRTPVDTHGFNWVLTEPAPPDPARVARLRAAYERLRRAGPGAALATLPFAPGEREQLNRDLYSAGYPPPHPGLHAARAELLDLSLLSPAQTADGERFIVHRWTAESLSALADPGLLRAAHARAAEYHRWRAGLYSTEGEGDLREAYFHFGAVGDTDAQAATAAELCIRLHARGAYHEEQSLCDEMLGRLAADNPQVALFLHTKAAVAMLRGEYPAAVTLQRRCLDRAEAASDPVAAATSCQQLGVAAQLGGDPAEAEERYRDAMRRCFEVGLDTSVLAQAVVAACYQQLGGLALERGDLDEARRWSEGALDIVTELGEESVLSATDDELARLALAFGDAALADEHALGSHELRATQPDVLRLAAAASLQLGAVHVLNDRPDVADHLLERAVELARRLDDLPLLARCLRLSGDVLFELGRLDEANDTYEAQLNLLRELDDQAGLIVVYQQLGRIAAARDDRAESEHLLGIALTLAEQAGNPRLVGATHLYRGSALSVDAPGDASQHLATGRDAAEQAGDDALWVSCVLHLAGLDAVEGRMAEALALARQGLDRAAAAHNDNAIIACHLTRGLLDRYRGADREAAHWIAGARRRALDIGHRRAVAQSDLQLARIAADDHDPDTAVAYYRHCLDVAGLDRHADLVWHARRELGRCLAEQSDHEAALPVLRQALEIVAGGVAPGPELWCLMRLMWSQDRVGEPVPESMVRRCAEVATAMPPSAVAAAGLLCAGDSAYDGDDETAARAYYERALAVAEKCGPLAAGQAVDGLWQLARLALDAGDAAQARDRYLVVGGIAEELGDRVAVVHVLRELGRVLRDLGEPAAAATALENSWEAALQLGDKRLAATSDLLLADLDDAAGRADTAQIRRTRVAEWFSQRSGARRAEHHPIYTSVLRSWRELRWSRRLRVADGETPFVRAMEQYLGPSIDDIVRDMTPLVSLVSGVPAAVAPQVRRRARSGEP
jgi:tetratricopeptide (TPR) repeat protein